MGMGGGEAFVGNTYEYEGKACHNTGCQTSNLVKSPGTTFYQVRYLVLVPGTEPKHTTYLLQSLVSKNRNPESSQKNTPYKKRNAACLLRGTM